MKKLLLLTTLCVFGFMTSYSQETVRGKVTDANGNPLSGASVVLKGTTAGTVTNTDGNYTLSVPSNGTLSYSFVGMQEQEVSVAGQKVINVTLLTTVLEDVVVIGYGTAKKRDLTGSIVLLKSEDIVEKPNANAVSSIQGKVSGLNIVNSGRPNEDSDVRMRGTISRGATKPLYVVDGAFVDDIRNINSNDISSVEVLKDPSSLAIFGSRGANGVIIVTTKTAKLRKLSVNYFGTAGYKSVTDKPSLTNGTQFRTLYDEQRVNQGDEPYKNYDKFDANTNWIDEISNEGASIQSHNLTIAKGTEKSKIYLSAGYLKEEGLINYETYKRINLSLNTESQLTDFAKLNVKIAYIHKDLPQYHSFNDAINTTPIVAPYNSTQNMYNLLPNGMGDISIANSLATVEIDKDTYLAEENIFEPNASLEIDILKDRLKFRAGFSGNLKFFKQRQYYPIAKVYSLETTTSSYFRNRSLTEVLQVKSDFYNYQQDYTLTYNNEFDKHNITALLGYLRYNRRFEHIQGNVKQYVNGDSIPNDERFWYLNVYPYGDPESRTARSEQWHDGAMASFLFRALYNYDEKYIFNVSFRRDGASAFSNTNNEWDNFWAIGAAWEMTKEDFMSDQQIFDLLKIKTSYGVLGNQVTAVHYPSYPGYASGDQAVFGGTVVPSYNLEHYYDKGIEWEKIKSTEVGFEMAALKRKLNLEAAYYNKKSEDLLAMVSISGENFFVNAGEMENKGFEISASWQDEINRDLSYSVSGNFTTYDNKVISVYEEGKNFTPTFEPAILKSGYPISSFYGYIVDGIYQTYADIETGPKNTLGVGGPGDFKYRDVNEDGTINEDDRTIIGNPTPDFTYGLSGNISYKNISFSIDCQGVYGNEIYRAWGNGLSYAQANFRTARLDRWTGEGTSNWEPRLIATSNYNTLPSTYMIEDGSYFRIRNINLAYDIDESLINKWNIQSLRIYANMQNPITFTNSSGFTPEAGGNATRFGVDNGGYPLPAIYSLGLNVGF